MANNDTIDRQRSSESDAEYQARLGRERAQEEAAAKQQRPEGESHEQWVARRKQDIAAQEKAQRYEADKANAERSAVTPEPVNPKNEKEVPSTVPPEERKSLPVAIPTDADEETRKSLMEENKQRGWIAYKADGAWQFSGRNGQGEPQHLVVRDKEGNESTVRAPEPREARDGQGKAAPKVSEQTAERLAMRDGRTAAVSAERAGSSPEAEMQMRRYMSGWIVQSSKEISEKQGRPPTFDELRERLGRKDIGISLTEQYDAETGRNVYYAAATSTSGHVYQASDKALGLDPKKGRDLDLLLRTGDAAKQQEEMGEAWKKVAESPTWDDLVTSQRRVGQKDIEKLAAILEKQTGGKYQMVAMNRGLVGNDRDGVGLTRYDVGIRGEDGKARSLRDLGIGDLSSTIRRDGQEPLGSAEHKSEVARQWHDFKNNLGHEAKTMFGSLCPAAFASERSIYAESPDSLKSKTQDAVAKPSEHFAQRGGQTRGRGPGR